MNNAKTTVLGAWLAKTRKICAFEEELVILIEKHSIDNLCGEVALKIAKKITERIQSEMHNTTN